MTDEYAGGAGWIRDSAGNRMRAAQRSVTPGLIGPFSVSWDDDGLKTSGVNLVDLDPGTIVLRVIILPTTEWEGDPDIALQVWLADEGDLDQEVLASRDVAGQGQFPGLHLVEGDFLSDSTDQLRAALTVAAGERLFAYVPGGPALSGGAADIYALILHTS